MLGRHVQQKSLYALGCCSELLLTLDDTLLFGIDVYGDAKKPRKTAILHHKFPHHDLTVEAVWPGLFVDTTGSYWDVPFSMAIDFASVAAYDSDVSYHLSMCHNSGSPEQFQCSKPQSSVVPSTVLLGLSIKSAFSYKKRVDIWRSEARKLKLVQPYDLFLSDPNVSASGIIGFAATNCLGDNSARAREDDRSWIDVLSTIRGNQWSLLLCQQYF